MLDSKLLALWQTGQWQQGLAALRIAHQLPGRVRLKLDTALSLAAALPSSDWLDYINLLVQLLERTAGIRSVRVNPLARSCILEYDPKVIPSEAWGDLLASKDSAAAQLLMAYLYDSYQEVVHAKLR